MNFFCILGHDWFTTLERRGTFIMESGQRAPGVAYIEKCIDCDKERAGIDFGGIVRKVSPRWVRSGVEKADATAKEAP